MIVKNIALLGHKDHGKSTLIGSLLMQTGSATKARIKEAEEYSMRLHKDFEPAFILDSFHEEREGGLTIDTTRAEIKYKNFIFELIDVPGHEEFIKNMISGASYGEVALLLVSVKEGEGIRDQTMRHIFIAKMLGIGKLVVAVNKMDAVDYDERKFNEVKDGLSGFVSKIGFAEKDVNFVPISAYRRENLVRRSSKMKWYGGKVLVDALYDNAKERERSIKHNGMRIIVQGMIPGNARELVAGKIVSGSIRTGERAIVLPQEVIVKVKSIMVKGRRASSGKMGENVALALGGLATTDIRGSIISDTRHTPEVTDRVMLKIFVAGKFEAGMQARFNGIEIPCKSINVIKGIDTTTGKTFKTKKPKVLEAVYAEMKLARKVPVEKYEVVRELGRFALYKGNELKGICIVV